MKKFISIISLCLVAVMLVSLLSACGAKEEKFVGTWVELDSNGEPARDGETLVLASDGTGSAKADLMSGSVSWNVEKDKVFITVSACGMTDTTEYTYKFSGDTLTLTDESGEKTVYRKNNSK